MFDKSKIKTGMMVHASGMGPGGEVAANRVGTVDHLDGEKYIKLNRKDSPDQQHHWIPIDWVQRVEGDSVYLSKGLEEVQKGMLHQSPIAA